MELSCKDCKQKEACGIVHSQKGLTLCEVAPVNKNENKIKKYISQDNVEFSPKRFTLLPNERFNNVAVEDYHEDLNELSVSVHELPMVSTLTERELSTLLFTIEGYSLNSIATKLKVSASTAQRDWHHARTKLKADGNITYKQFAVLYLYLYCGYTQQHIADLLHTTRESVSVAYKAVLRLCSNREDMIRLLEEKKSSITHATT